MQEEYESATIQEYFRTESECSAPFDDATSAVIQAGLRLLSIQYVVGRCPYNVQWLESGDQGRHYIYFKRGSRVRGGSRKF